MGRASLPAPIEGLVRKHSYWLVGVAFVALVAPAGVLSDLAHTSEPKRASSFNEMPSSLAVTSSSVNVSLTLQPNASVNLSSPFWGTSLAVSSPIGPNESDAVNATPARIVVWPAGTFGDEYNPFTNNVYQDSGRPTTPSANESGFVAWCRSIGCRAIFQVPGEIDDPTFAASEVQYTEAVLGFYPEYWEIGNEPARWQHFGIPWSQWSSTQTSTPSATEYAVLVQHYFNAMRAIDPSIRIIGLPGYGRGAYLEPTWIKAVVGVDGPNLSAVAIHVYPDGLGPNGPPNLDRFFGTLNGKGSILARAATDRHAISSACARCGPISLFVTEVGSEVAYGNDDRLVQSFPDVPYIGDEIIQAMDANLTNVDYFAYQYQSAGSWFNTTGPARPVFDLYAAFFSHLGRTVTPVLATGAPSGFEAISTAGGVTPGSHDVLIVNANATKSATIDVSAVGSFAVQTSESWWWNGTTAAPWSPVTPSPIPEFWPKGIPSTWTVPPVSLLLLETSSIRSVPVHITESGLIPGTRWYLAIGTRTETSPASDMTFWLPSGSYAVIPQPTLYYGPFTRQLDSTDARLNVSGSPVSGTIRYWMQYFVQPLVYNGFGGTVTPSAQWMDEGTPFVTQAAANVNDWFVQWYGSGAGSYSGSADPAKGIVLGPIVEEAVFAPKNDLLFQTGDLPSASIWSVQLGSSTGSSSGPAIPFNVTPGSYSYSIPALSGFTPEPSSGIVHVTGTGQNVTVRWVANGSLLGNPITWIERGLPSGTEWSITAAGIPHASTTDHMVIVAPNGTLPFTVSETSGCIPAPPSGFVMVNGQPLTITIEFSCPRYSIRVGESGLPPGTPWTVALDQTNATSISSTIDFFEPNGSYSLTVANLPGWKPSTAHSSVHVAGQNVSLTIPYEQAIRAAVPFPLSGIPISTWVLAGAIGSVVFVLMIVLRRFYRQRPWDPPIPGPKELA